MISIAHIREHDKEIQTVETHLLEVKNLAEQYGGKLDIKHLCGLAGLLHDLGKYSNEFKNYILEAVNNPNDPPKRGSVDHSTAGGKLLYDLYHKSEDPYMVLLAQIVGNTIISHHSYLHDYLNEDLESKYLIRVCKDLEDFDRTKRLFFKKVMNEKEFDNYIQKAKEELINYLEMEDGKGYARKLMFLTKYIFSALIDADRTNSRVFDENNYREIDGSRVKLFSGYYEKLMNKINEFKIISDAKSPINQLRSIMSNQCDAFAEKPSGIYTLSIPTGGGKTLASLRYALRHAELYNKKRIIYIVPYTTIIEQNANEVREILQDYSNILEHHSNIIHDDVDDDEADDGRISERQKLKLAKDNWDSPIIFTTMVQFLDTFYAYGGRNIRRLHNLSESVIIFDEVQKVPVHCVSLFNHALNFLKTYGKSSIVLCTATQPALDFVQNKLDINLDAEIIEDIDHVVKSFKRVDIIDKATQSPFTQDKLVDFIYEKLTEINNVLIILNTKKAVKDLYEVLLDFDQDIQVYHLSTSMCPRHRTIILDKVKKHLKNHEKVICVSTQLIEAGVDISFECVIRSLAGLDSVAQAAGRCNRHGEEERRNVYVIDYENENLSKLKEIAIGKEITKNILKDLDKDSTTHGGNLLSLQAMERYFKEYYTDYEFDLDYPIKGMNETMIELLMADGLKNAYLKAYIVKKKKPPSLSVANSYNTAARNFKVIDSPTTSVIVPYGSGKEIIADLNSDIEIGNLTYLLQKAQQFTVNLYEQQLRVLKENDSLTTIFNDSIYVLKEGAYDNEYGVNIEGDSSLDLLSF